MFVVTAHRQTRRQVARALGAGGITTRFIESVEELRGSIGQPADLIIIDCDNNEEAVVEAALELLNGIVEKPPVVLLSIGADKRHLLRLVQRHDVGNLVAKHGAIRAIYPVLDERELLVTCEKVIRRNIFGIDKYVGSWGVVLHRAIITGVADKVPCLTRFEQFLNDLDCPLSVIPGIVTVAEELILNAVVHAPRLPDGTPRYEATGLVPSLVLEPHEYVSVVYGCDGQRLMFSVTDNFGRLDKTTLYTYTSKGFGSEPVEAEDKPSGAGLGLSLAFRSIHQLIFNIHDSVKTEVIAGWYLRVPTASEFRQVSKSFNLFWLPRDIAVQPRAPEEPAVLRGRIDETTDFAPLLEAETLDLRAVSAITSHGLLRWLRFVRSRAGRRLALRGCPDAFVRAAMQVAGVMQGVTVQTVMVPFECDGCPNEVTIELSPEEVFRPTDRACSRCGGRLRFSGEEEQYYGFLGALATLSRAG